MPEFLIPQEDKVVELLTMVVGDDVSVTTSAEQPLASYSHMARFLDDSDELVGICCVDLPLAAALGGGLSMIPPAAVAEMVTDTALTPIATDNLYEVMNMLSSLYMDDKTPHLRLTTVDDGVAGDLATADYERVDLDVVAGKYGQGQVAFLAQ